MVEPYHHFRLSPRQAVGARAYLRYPMTCQDPLMLDLGLHQTAKDGTFTCGYNTIDLFEDLQKYLYQPYGDRREGHGRRKPAPHPFPGHQKEGQAFFVSVNQTHTLK